MKYILKRDLPFAKPGAEVTKTCDIIDKDGYAHDLSYGKEPIPQTFERLINEGWIEEVKPEEIYINTYATIRALYYTAEEAKNALSEGGRTIKFREVIE